MLRTDILLNLALFNKIKRMISDDTHPINKMNTYSERSSRIDIMKANRERYKNIFVPSAVKLYYDTKVRKQSSINTVLVFFAMYLFHFMYAMQLFYAMPLLYVYAFLIFLYVYLLNHMKSATVSRGIFSCFICIYLS